MGNWLIPQARPDEKDKGVLITSGSSVSLQDSETQRDEVFIPSSYGDLTGLAIQIQASVSGTLSSAVTIEKVLKTLNINKANGESIFKRIRGQDLVFYDRVFNGGRSRTVPTASSSTQTHTLFVPLNIEKLDLPARLQVVLSAFGDMASSGAEGGTVSYRIFGYFVPTGSKVKTDVVSRQTISLSAGVQTLAEKLPSAKQYNQLLFTIGTEANINSMSFSSNGGAELLDFQLTDLIAPEQSRLIDGHVTGQFILPVAPFLKNDNTIFTADVESSDSLEIHLWSN